MVQYHGTNIMTPTLMELSHELAQLAARHIAEEGLTYGQAKRKAAKQAGIASHSAAMPSNEAVEQALRAYLQEFQSDTQPEELAMLRGVALNWLTRLPRLPGLNEPCQALATGAVVNGTANEHSAVHLQVFVDDDKHLEIALLDAGFELSFTEQTVDGLRCPVLVAQDQGIPVALTIVPKSRYKAPQSVHSSVWQAATAQQLQSLIAL